MTALTLVNENGRYDVSSIQEDMTIEEITNLFKALLVAATYPVELVEEYLGEDGER